MVRPPLTRLLWGLLPLLGGCLQGGQPPASPAWLFQLTAVADGGATAVAASPAPTSSSPTPAGPGSAAPSPSPSTDLADAVAQGSLQTRLDALAEAGGQPDAAALAALAEALRPALAALMAADLDRVAADPANLPSALADRLVAYGSPTAMRFRDAGDALAAAVRARLAAGATRPTSPGMYGLYFGHGYTGPVIQSGGSGGGGSSGPAPTPTPGAGLTLAAEGGAFRDPAASEAAVAGP